MTIECLHMNHINAVVDDFEGAVAHFRRAFGAQFVMDLPQPEWHACLIYVAGVLFELFSPPQFLLNARYGPHWVGIEYQVDMEAARAEVAERNIRVIRDIGVAIHTHPMDTTGIAWEFFGDNFHVMPENTWLEPLKPADYWRDEHPLGLLGLEHYSVAVADLDQSTAFMADFLGATRLYEESRPAIGARVVGLALAETTVELMSPVGSGVIEQHLRRYGDGIRSTVFAVSDLDRARAHFRGLGIELVPGDAPSTVAIAPADNVGVMMELCARG